MSMEISRSYMSEKHSQNYCKPRTSTAYPSRHSCTSVTKDESQQSDNSSCQNNNSQDHVKNYSTTTQTSGRLNRSTSQVISLPQLRHQMAITTVPRAFSQLPDKPFTTLNCDTSNGSKSKTSRFQLEQWAYETYHENMSLAEKLEKSKWEIQRLERL